MNDISVEEGDEVAAGATLLQVVDFDNLRVSVRVDEYDISSLYVGQACSVNVTALDLTFDSQIKHINRISASSGGTAYYTVTAEVTVTDDVLPGMQVTVTIPEEEAVDAVILSKDALSFDASNNAYVLMLDESGQMTASMWSWAWTTTTTSRSSPAGGRRRCVCGAGDDEFRPPLACSRRC